MPKPSFTERPTLCHSPDCIAWKCGTPLLLGSFDASSPPLKSAPPGRTWSAISDGQYLAATTRDNEKLMLYDFKTQKWAKLQKTRKQWADVKGERGLAQIPQDDSTSVKADGLTPRVNTPPLRLSAVPGEKMSPFFDSENRKSPDAPPQIAYFGAYLRSLTSLGQGRLTRWVRGLVVPFR